MEDQVLVKGYEYLKIIVILEVFHANVRIFFVEICERGSASSCF